MTSHLTQGTRSFAAAAVTGLLLLGVSACGDDRATSSAPDQQVAHAMARQEKADAAAAAAAEAALPTRPPGVVQVTGTTATSLTKTLASSYAQNGTDVQVSSSSAEDSFASLCSGTTDVVDSLRPISVEEWQDCRDHGLEVVQLQVASRAIVVATKSETDVGGDCLATDEVRDMFRAGSPVTSWSQVGLTELPLHVGGPDLSSPSFTFFGASVLDTESPALTNLRSDYTAFADDHALRTFLTGNAADERRADRYDDLKRDLARLNDSVGDATQAVLDARTELQAANAERAKGIRDVRTPAAQAKDQARVDKATSDLAKRQSEKAALLAKRAPLQAKAGRAERSAKAVEAAKGRVAIVPFDYYELFEDQLRAFEITPATGKQDCIFPSAQTITSGTYPLSQPLLLTTTTRSWDRSEVHGFFEYYLGHAQAAASRARLVPLSGDTLDRQKSWLSGDQDPVLVGPADEPEATPSSAAPLEPAR